VLSPAGNQAVLHRDDGRPAMELEDQNCWTIAEAISHRRPCRLHHFLSTAVWDQELMLDIAAAWAAARLDDGDGVLISDETGDAKSSAHAAGAARQYSASTGGLHCARPWSP
jgi:SRSO17 transposase